MRSVFITKRPHKKSRAGCKTCKNRKIKCDEGQPKCTFCKKRNLLCEYIIPTSKSSPASPAGSHSSIDDSICNSPLSQAVLDKITSIKIVPALRPTFITVAGALNATDLRMLNHWCVSTAETTTVGETSHRALQTVVPQLAFENSFLLNAIMGIASFHLNYLLPETAESRKQTEIYRSKALHLFRTSLPEIYPGNNSYEAALITSLLFVVLFSPNAPIEGKDGLVIGNWLILYRGLATIINMVNFIEVRQMSISPILRRELCELKIPPIIPKILLQLLQSIPPEDPDMLHKGTFFKVLDMLGNLYASLSQDGLTSFFFVRVISWPSFLSQEFTNLTKAKNPRALVILAYYMLFIKLAKGVWWLKGIADRDLDTLFRIVGPEWWEYLAVPMQVRMVNNVEDIVRLMRQ